MIDDLPISEVLELLTTPVTGLREVSHVEHFSAFRDRPDGTTERVTIEVHRIRPLADGGQWYIKATDERGNLATGNVAESLAMAISITPWNKLDQ